MTKIIRWRLHAASPPEKLFELLTTDGGRESFWADRSTSTADDFTLIFPGGTEERCPIIEAVHPSRFVFEYFGSVVEVELASDGSGGTDLLLTNSGVSQEEHAEVHAGWVSVLLPLKAVADFGVDLRNHDPARTWRQLYVDQ